MTFRKRLLDLSRQRAALAQVVANFEEKRQIALASLPATFGFNNLDEFIKAVKTAAAPASRPRKTYSRQVPRPMRPRKSADATNVAVAAPALVIVEASSVAPEPTVTPAPVAVTPVPLLNPSGSDLNDPHNFGLLPDSELLDESASPRSGYYDRLSAQLGFARKVLATSGVPASVWRQWRGFEQKAGDILRDRHQVPESL